MFPNRIQKTFYATFSWSIIVHGLVLQVPLPDPSCLYVFNTIQRKKTHRESPPSSKRNILILWGFSGCWIPNFATSMTRTVTATPWSPQANATKFFICNIWSPQISARHSSRASTQQRSGVKIQKRPRAYWCLVRRRVALAPGHVARCVCPQPGQERSKLPAG